MPKPEIRSPFAKPVQTRYQFSLHSMLLLIAVAAITLATFGWFIQTPGVAREIAAWTGQTMPTLGGDGRLQQLKFSLICYCSPLMLALVVQVFSRANRWWFNREDRRQLDDVDPFA